jgi:hypothetical protein
LYLGRVKSGFAMFGVLIGSAVVFVFVGIMAGSFLMTVLVVWCFADLVLIAVMVKQDRNAASNFGADSIETVFR